jgi:hypothetical protein
VPGISGGNRLSRFGNTIARQHLRTFFAAEQFGIQTEPGGQWLVHPDEARGPDRSGQDTREEPFGQPRIRVVERKRN